MDNTEKQNAKKQLLKETDLLLLLEKVFSKWKLIITVVLGFSVFGIIIAFSTIKKYTAEIMVAPESSGNSLMSGGLGAIASMAGIDMGTMTSGNDAIYPMLYPDIIQSLPFLTSLFDVNVKTYDGAVDTTYYYYKTKFEKKTWLEYAKASPKKAIQGVKRLFSPAKQGGDPAVFDPYKLSEAQMRRVEALNGCIGVFVDKKTDVISLSFTDKDPQVAAIMVDTIMACLQGRITEYRTRKAITDCEYIERLFNKSKTDYEEAQMAYANYLDRNLNIVSERQNVEKERLEADKDLKNTLYTQWAQQLQLAKAKVQEHTPAFTTLKPAAVPAMPSSMRRLYVVIIYGILGGILAVGYVLFQDSAVRTLKKLFKKK